MGLCGLGMRPVLHNASSMLGGQHLLMTTQNVALGLGTRLLRTRPTFYSDDLRMRPALSGRMRFAMRTRSTLIVTQE